MTPDDRLARFLSVSADLTAFTAFQMQGTGQAPDYLSAVTEVVGEAVVDELLDAHERARAELRQDEAELDDLLRREILSDEKLGPVARNVIKLWYVGIWYELPRAWTEAFGALEKDLTFTVSPAAYTEGLLWPAIGANPPGAKAPGYGSWVGPPRIPGNGTAR
jgi:hypothetical protein